MADLIPIVGHQAFIDPYFNGVISEGFLCGVYTLFLVQAVWRLHRQGKKIFYSGALILLWISVILAFVNDWVSIRFGFVVQNSTSLAILRTLDNITSVFGNLLVIFVICISDGILIWRCKILWHSRFVMFALISFLVAALGLWICNILFPDRHFTLLTNALGLFCSVITTVFATSMIALKIGLSARESRMHRFYFKIVRILIESAALVSIVGLGVAILNLMSVLHPFDLGTASGRILSQTSQYLEYIQGPIIGIGPTLIAFRIAQEPAQTEVSSTIRIAPLSQQPYRRNVQPTGVKRSNETPGTQVSTMYFGLPNSEESTSSDIVFVDTEAQSISDGQEKTDNANNVERITVPHRV